MAKADSRFPISRKLVIAFALITASVAVLMLYKVASYILWPMWRFAWETPWQAFGLALILGPIIMAYPSHYFLNVRKTNAAGVIEVDGFWGYTAHLFANLAARIGFPATMILGFYVLFAYG